MFIVHYSNFINHHMVWLADELYHLTNGRYSFVCTENIPESYTKTGYPNYFERPYVIRCFEEEGYKEATSLALTADVAIFNGNKELDPFRMPRLERDLLSFESGERWLKKGILNVLSPRLLHSQFLYHTMFRKCKNYYALTTSAFGAHDYQMLHSFKGRCFKWGYFTNVEPFDVSNKEFLGTRIMWVSRFIDWKHPELPIKLAKMLKEKGVSFTIDMFGGGVLHENMQQLSKGYNVDDCVFFRGNLPNSQIIDEMRNHDIVLATSDQNEGWGAVVNEAMSNGCVLVGSNLTGSVPFLVKHEDNGLIFKSNDILSLLDCVISVIGNPAKCKALASKAYNTMRDVWSPNNAAQSFINLSNCLMRNEEPNIQEGPCSCAL